MPDIRPSPRHWIPAFLTTLAMLPGAAPAHGQPKLPPDLSVVSPDAVALIYIRPADVWSGTSLGGIRKQFPEAAESLVKALGEDPGETESFLLLFPSINILNGLTPDFSDDTASPVESLVMVETTVKPVKQDTLLERVLGKGAVSQKHKGKTYFRSNSRAGFLSQGAVYFVNNRTYVYAMTDEVMRKTLDGLGSPRKSGPLDNALKLAGQKRQFVVGVNATHPSLDRVRKDLRQSLTISSRSSNPIVEFGFPGFGALAPLLEVRSVALAVNVNDGKELRFEGEMSFSSERDAAEASGPLEDALVLTRFFLFGQLRIDLRQNIQRMIRADEDKEGSLVFGNQVLIGSKKTRAKRDIRPLVLAEVALKQVENGLRKVKVEQRKNALTLLTQVPLAAVDKMEAQARGDLERAVKAQETMRVRRRSSDHMQTLMLAIHDYHDVNKRFPSSAICDAAGTPLLSWRVAILPYIGEFPLYRQFKLTEPWDSAHNIKLLEKMPAVFKAPGAAAKDPHATFYQLFTGPEAAFDTQSRLTIASITDGTSNTIGLAEARDPVPWTRPADLVYDAAKPLPKLGGVFADGFHVAFLDASVRFLPPTVPEAIMRAMITRAGGEVIAVPGDAALPDFRDVPPREKGKRGASGTAP